MKIKDVKINYRKKNIEINTSKRILGLPFSRLNLIPTKNNKIIDIYIDKEMDNRGITYRLESGDEDSIHLDAFLDYNKDPDFILKVTLHKLTLEANRLLENSGLSKHEIIRHLHTSPSQLYRLLDTANYKKSINEMLRLISVLGYRLEWNLIKDAA